MLNNTDFFQNHTNSTSQESTVINHSKMPEEKDIYVKYREFTFGTVKTYIELLLFKQFTNATKSKYDNVVGWIRSK